MARCYLVTDIIVERVCVCVCMQKLCGCQGYGDGGGKTFKINFMAESFSGHIVVYEI